MMRSNTSWQIATSSSLQAVVDDPHAPPSLTAPLRHFLPWQVRNETTIERVIATPQLAAPWVATLVALGAEVFDGQTSLPVAQAMYRRHSWQMLTIPDEAWMVVSDYVARAPTDEPIVYAVAARWVEDGVLRGIRLALTGVSRLAVFVPTAPERWIGQPFDEEALRSLARAVAEEVRPRGDFRGSEEYRRAMAEVLTRRVLSNA